MIYNSLTQATFQVYRSMVEGVLDRKHLGARIALENLIKQATQGAYDWTVVGVSEDALNFMRAQNWDTRGLNRAHIVGRCDTMYKALELDFQTEEEFYDYFLTPGINDCILATKAQNKVKNPAPMGKVFPLPTDLFPPASLGFAKKKGYEQVLASLA